MVLRNSSGNLTKHLERITGGEGRTRASEVPGAHQAREARLIMGGFRVIALARPYSIARWKFRVSGIGPQVSYLFIGVFPQ